MKDEAPFDFVRPKKKYTKREKLYPPRRPGRPPSQYTINKADIKQYDFHSSGEEDFPVPPVSIAHIRLARIMVVPKAVFCFIGLGFFHCMEFIKRLEVTRHLNCSQS